MNQGPSPGRHIYTPNENANYHSTPISQPFMELKEKWYKKYIAIYFFLPLVLLFGTGAWLEAVDITLEAREEGAAEVALLPAPDLRLSSALFCSKISMNSRIIGTVVIYIP